MTGIVGKLPAGSLRLANYRGFLPMPLEARNRLQKGCAGPSFTIDEL
jgi:hypothetical protein